MKSLSLNRSIQVGHIMRYDFQSCLFLIADVIPNFSKVHLSLRLRDTQNKVQNG